MITVRVQGGSVSVRPTLPDEDEAALTYRVDDDDNRFDQILMSANEAARVAYALLETAQIVRDGRPSIELPEPGNDDRLDGVLTEKLSEYAVAAALEDAASVHARRLTAERKRLELESRLLLAARSVIEDGITLSPEETTRMLGEYAVNAFNKTEGE